MLFFSPARSGFSLRAGIFVCVFIAVSPVPPEQCLAHISSPKVFVEYMEGRKGGRSSLSKLMVLPRGYIPLRGDGHNDLETFPNYSHLYQKNSDVCFLDLRLVRNHCIMNTVTDGNLWHSCVCWVGI